MELAAGRNTVLLTSFELMAQTFMYGIFVAIMPAAMKIWFQHDLRRGPNAVLMWLTLTAFVLSTGYLALSVAAFISKVTGEHLAQYSSARAMFNSVMLINLLFADGVVVWRMYVLCASHYSRGVFLLPLLLLGLLWASVLATIALRLASVASQRPVISFFLTAQHCSAFSSLATNLAATAIICVWICQRRHAFAENMRTSNAKARKVEHALALLAESGVAYCLSSTIHVVLGGVHTPLGGTVGDVYTPMHLQLAGLYPALVIILIHSSRSTQASSQFEASTGILTEDVAIITRLSDSSIA